MRLSPDQLEALKARDRRYCLGKMTDDMVNAW